MIHRLLAFVFLLHLPTNVRADQVVLTNGDRLSGSIVASEPQGLRFKSDLLGDVHVKWTVIKRITSDQALFVTLKDGRVLSGTVALSGTNVELRGPGTPTSTSLDQVQAVRSADEQASFERLENPRFFELWAGSVDAGLSAAQGNTDILTVTVDAKASRTTHRDKTSLYYTSLFNRDRSSGETATAANAIRSGARYDISLRKRLYVFGFTDFESDELQDLNLRNVVGGGMGWRFVKSRKTMFDVFSGGSFNQEYFSTKLDRKTAEFLLGEELTHKLAARSVFTERLGVFPNLSERGEYRVSFDGSATTKLNHWLNWEITLSDRLLSNPVPGAKRNDAVLSTGLGITFGEENPFHGAFRFVELLVPTHE